MTLTNFTAKTLVLDFRIKSRPCCGGWKSNTHTGLAPKNAKRTGPRVWDERHGLECVRHLAGGKFWIM